MTGKDDVQAVERANARFYRALSKADLKMMAALWSHRDDVTCLHPGWPLLRGWDDVRASWRGIFENQGPIRIWPDDVTIAVNGDAAWLVCTENLDASGTDETLGVVIQVQATNIFRWEDGAWHMVHHHASQQPQPPLNAPGQLGPTSISQN